MALLEDTNTCSICEAPVSGYVGGVPVYFCPACWAAHQQAIVEKDAAWIMMLLGLEKARRSGARASPDP